MNHVAAEARRFMMMACELRCYISQLNVFFFFEMGLGCRLDEGLGIIRLDREATDLLT
jgi:hypothetical protein